jgi:hypothetical protein
MYYIHAIRFKKMNGEKKEEENQLTCNSPLFFPSPPPIPSSFLLDLIPNFFLRLEDYYDSYFYYITFSMCVCVQCKKNGV